MKTKLAGNKKISCINEVEFEKIYKQIFEEEEYPINFNTASPIIIDAGAHIGITTLYFKEKYPNAKIIAFEPNPTNFSLLQLNIKQNYLENVLAQNVAIYDKEGYLDFFIDIDDNNPWTWGDSLVENIGFNPNESKSQSKTIKVSTITLAQYLIGEIDLLKLDVEGVECKVLKSIQHKLFHIKQIMLEFHGNKNNPDNNLQEVLNILKSNGFQYTIKQNKQYIKENEIVEEREGAYWLMIYAKKI